MSRVWLEQSGPRKYDDWAALHPLQVPESECNAYSLRREFSSFDSTLQTAVA
jgi:hypothetical protein